MLFTYLKRKEAKTHHDKTTVCRNANGLVAL